MAETFRSEVELIADQALKTFNQLDKAADKFTSALQRQAIAVGGFNKITKAGFTGIDRTALGLDKATLASKAFSQAIGKSGLVQFCKEAKGATRDVHGLRGSYDSFIRLVTSQIVSRVIATLAQSFREATTAARDLEITIARIQTLDEGLRLRSIDSLSNQLQTLSGQFAQPIEDLAAGLYDTISNQVGSAADSVNVLTEALRLQLLVGGDVSSNVDLLSSVINAYSITANRASVITDKLFAGIDLGRVTAEELGNRFGRVATQGAQLGVSLDELVGTIAAATINGIKGSEALTQLGQEIVSLTKPSTAMSEALKAAGISSVELAVSTTSLADVLKRVIATTDGTQESIARLFPNIRAARLALARLSDTGNVFESTIDAVGERVGATADEMENLIRNTNAFKLNQEFEKFQAILTSEGARAFNESLLGLIQSLGGAENAGRLAAESFKLIIPVGIAGTIGITAVIFGKLSTSIKAAASAAIGAKAAFAAASSSNIFHIP